MHMCVCMCACTCVCVWICAPHPRVSFANPKRTHPQLDWPSTEGAPAPHFIDATLLLIESTCRGLGAVVAVHSSALACFSGAVQIPFRCAVRLSLHAFPAGSSRGPSLVGNSVNAHFRVFPAGPRVGGCGDLAPRVAASAAAPGEGAGSESCGRRSRALF